MLKVLFLSPGTSQPSEHQQASASELAQRLKNSTLESQPRPASLNHPGNGRGSRAQILSVQATGVWVQTSARRGIHATVLRVCWLLFHYCDQISDKQPKGGCLFWLKVVQHSAHSCLPPCTWTEHHGSKSLQFTSEHRTGRRRQKGNRSRIPPKDLPQ